MQEYRTTGAMIGMDDFFKDFENIALSETPINQDQLLVEIVERCIENQGSIFGLVINEEKTKNKKAVVFDFMCGGDESLEELIIIYLGSEVA